MQLLKHGPREGTFLVEADPAIDGLFCLEAVGDFMKIDATLFQDPP